jgi:hypothetical protein
VVELVDARDSKSRSARSVGSIPTARTIHDSRLREVHRTEDGSLHQRIAWGRTSRAPLREMTSGRIVMLALGIPPGMQPSPQTGAAKRPLSVIDWLSLYQSYYANIVIDRKASY